MKEVAIWVWIGWIKWILWVICLHQGEGEQEGLGDGDPPHDLSRRGDVPPGRLAGDHLHYCRALGRGAVLANVVGSTTSLMQAAGGSLAVVWGRRAA